MSDVNYCRQSNHPLLLLQLLFARLLPNNCWALPSLANARIGGVCVMTSLLNVVYKQTNINSRLLFTENT